MNRRRSVRTISLWAVVLAVLLVVPAGRADAQDPPPTFEVELLARPLGFQSVPFDLNEAGQAVGYYLDFSLNYRSILWQADGTPVDLAEPGSWSQAHGIADDGTVGGYYGATLSATRPSVWDGDWSALRLRRGYSGGSVEALNSSGLAVGSSLHRTRTWRPVSWSGRRMTVLAASGAAFDVNEAGTIVGWTLVNGFPAAAAWVGTNLTLLTDGDRARAVSSDGRILGSSTEAGTNASRPTVWNDLGAAPVQLPRIDGLTGSGADINADGWVVGVDSLDPYNLSGDAVLWLPDGTAHKLNDLIPQGSGWDLVSAIAVNDGGQILGFGTCTCASGQSAFLLTPSSPS